MVGRQLEAIFEELPPVAAKSGLLFSAEIVGIIARRFRGAKAPPLVVDPVMVSSSGRRLLPATGIEALRRHLLCVAALVTPNLDEASLLADRTVNSIDTMRDAARVIRSRYGCAALIKGGHLRGGKEAVDIFFDGRTELLLTAPFVRGVRTHGTGCTYSAAITAWLALGSALPRAVERAKQYVTRAIAGGLTVHGHLVLDHLGAAAHRKVPVPRRSVHRP
jgi:hydroxymethylpyrimidine/phosphomethylpyrimidine kinase